MSAIDVIVPVLNRPQNVAPLVESFLATTPPDLATLNFVYDVDDTDELDAIAPFCEANLGVVDGIPNDHPKIKTFAHKVNLAYRLVTAPWLFLCGDDVAFENHWAQEALTVAEDQDAKLVATNDQLNAAVAKGLHATHPLISREWIETHGASWDGPGTVCHEGYRHWYVDNEWTTVARQAGVFAYAKHSIVEHRHHLNDKAPMDDTYRKGLWYRERDARLWAKRFVQFAR